MKRNKSVLGALALTLLALVTIAATAYGVSVPVAPEPGATLMPSITRTPGTVTGTVIIVDEGFSQPFDASRGDTVHVRLEPTGDPAARCADMGGTIDGLLCRSVDF